MDFLLTLSFYNFEALCDANGLRSPFQFTKIFREMLDKLSLNPIQQKDVIDEVIIAFEKHIELFEDLGSRDDHSVDNA